MNKLKTSLFATLILFAAYACDQNTSTNENTEAATTEAVEATEVEPGIDVEAAVSSINELRTQIETNIGDPVEVMTTELRAKIKQKWSKIHFYTIDGNVVRIKTYPHESISTRTEEFYLQDGNLVLAIIEDDGTGERGKSEEQVDKMYYYADGKAIKEVRSEEEGEYEVGSSDANELISEVKEYLSIYAKNAQ